MNLLLACAFLSDNQGAHVFSASQIDFTPLNSLIQAGKHRTGVFSISSLSAARLQYQFNCLLVYNKR